MSVVNPDKGDRPVRVTVPVRVSFSGETFLIREFTANLGVGGIFLLTERPVEAGTEGQLVFRGSYWEDPFTVRGRVVRAEPADPASNRPAGLGIQFLDLDERARRKLQRLVDGVQDGSVVQAIRRKLREGGGDLLQEIRRRPVDQRLMLALQAADDEIDALIRDGNSVVVERLLENPRLNVRHVRTISRDPRLRTQTMIALGRQERWLDDEEVRFNFCAHRSSPIPDVLRMLSRLSSDGLKKLAQLPHLRPAVRVKARELSVARGRERT